MLKKLQACLKNEDGQGLVEFAVVLPILLLLTVGTLLLTLSYMQKARMNGLAYMSARVTAVRRDNFDGPQKTLAAYQQRSQQQWVSSVSVLPQPNSENQVSTRLSKPGERLDILANLISGRPSPERPSDLIVEIKLNKEYRESGSLRPQTYSEVDYHHQAKALSLPSLIPASILNKTQMADPMSGSIAERDKILGLTPPNRPLAKFYTDIIDWGPLAYGWNEEKAAGDFASMQVIHENFKKIETGGNVLDLILSFLPFINKIKAIVGDIAEAAALQVEQTMSGLAQNLDQEVRASVQQDSLP